MQRPALSCDQQLQQNDEEDHCDSNSPQPRCRFLVYCGSKTLQLDVHLLALLFQRIVVLLQLLILISDLVQLRLVSGALLHSKMWPAHFAGLVNQGIQLFASCLKLTAKLLVALVGIT